LLIITYYYISLGSYPNSHRQIEPELLRIIMQNWRLDDLLSNQLDNLKLKEGLKFVQPRPTLGSLAAYDEFEFDELYRFIQNFHLETDDIITGIESFPGEMMKPVKIGVNLPEEIYNSLIQYYKDVYDLNFISFTESASNRNNNIRNSDQQIIVLPRINQFSRIRIGSEIFGSIISPRYKKNSYILANFIQENEITERFPGQVQYFFEHTVKLLDGYHTHRLAFVKWYLPVESRQKRFYCQINQDENSCNIEMWKYDFYNTGRDSIIPVHNIYSRFVASNFIIGKRNPITYMAVIPINRHFYI
jgi:hypothetical protein